MPLPLIPLGIAALAGTAIYRTLKKPTGMTPERRQVYTAALNTLKDPAKLRALADAFQKEGLIKEAELLRKRARLRELPKAKRDERRNIFKKGMASKDPDAVERLAAAYDKEGATGAAAALRKYATGLRKSKSAA